jgi:hypothetical protein
MRERERGNKSICKMNSCSKLIKREREREREREIN